MNGCNVKDCERSGAIFSCPSRLDGDEMLNIRLSLEFSENYHELALQDDFEDASKARMKLEMAKVKKLLRKVMKWINDIDDEDERLSSEVVFCPNRFNGEEMIVIYNAFHHEICMLTNFRDHYEKHFDVDDAEAFCRKMIKKVKRYLDIAGINLVPISAE